ncbi:MAG: hypothetical protein KKD64_01305 [Alphaproteobacteria bacterium]|nr:hypothetical protein [Alphaproteobacteria bacterium]MBU0793521.1 hypothetical protein [Alphaproteobacteria bacterium]MBU0877497.1 hypothetical protein [Alphaproteobacteria bacterium]MBU1768279.1 hypothetical protein [Alphaproteobacteria bacterium]
MRGYFLGGSLVLAFLYLIAAAFLIHIIGVELTRYWSTLMMAAGVMLGGTYGIVLFVSLGLHIIRRLTAGRPVMDQDD